MLPERRIGVMLHLYQPPRRAYHNVLKNINTDPLGVDWTQKIAGECYTPLAQLGVFAKVSFDVYGTLDRALEDIDPETVAVMRVNMVVNGVADSYIHPLLPDLSKEDKCIVVGAGIKRFVDITGKSPRFFWPPETAIDTETLEVLAEYGIEGFFCSPDQIELSDGSDANNIPTRIRLPGGRTIMAIAFDKELSHRLAFGDKSDAHKFTNEVIQPALSRLRNGFPLVGCADGETFGHHMPRGGDFLDTLLNRALPESGIKPVSINEVEFGSVTIADGRVKERSSWSCAHGDLARWHGACDCCGRDVDWKKPFSQAMQGLNGSVTKLVRAELGRDYLDRMITHFEEGFENPGADSATPELFLISAKVSALTALTSCGTFFADPGVSGRSNILFARQAVEYLKDAGLAQDATRIWSQFLSTMAEMHNPVDGRSGVEMAKDLLGSAYT